MDMFWAKTLPKHIESIEQFHIMVQLPKESVSLCVCVCLFWSETESMYDKHPGGLFSARVGAWLYKERLCCEQQKNVEILMVL